MIMKGNLLSKLKNLRNKNQEANKKNNRQPSIADKLAKFNLILTFVWVALTAPSLTWWKNSILWVILISLWANIVGHFSAYIAARSERAQQEGHNLTEADKKWIKELVEKSMKENITITQPHVCTTDTNTANQ